MCITPPSGYCGNCKCPRCRDIEATYTCKSSKMAEEYERVKKLRKKLEPSWVLNPGPSDFQSDALTPELLESLSRRAVGKLNPLVALANRTWPLPNCNNSLSHASTHLPLNTIKCATPNLVCTLNCAIFGGMLHMAIPVNIALPARDLDAILTCGAGIV